MRALLRLARPGLEGRVFRRENLCLRDAGRTLSPVRDAQVLGAAFEKLLASDARPQPSGAGAESIRLRLAEDARATAADADLPRTVPETIDHVGAGARTAGRHPTRRRRLAAGRRRAGNCLPRRSPARCGAPPPAQDTRKIFTNGANR